MPPRRFLVAQLGARMHYAVPRILHKAGLLSGFFTDVYASHGFPRLLSLLPNRLRKGSLERLLERRLTEIPSALVHSFPLLGLEYKRRLQAARSAEESVLAHLWMSRAFAERVARNLSSSWNAAYVFNSAGLEILERCRATGALGCLEQCSSPHLKERHLVREESLRFPEWGTVPDTDQANAAYGERERNEWAAADVIICPSEFVRSGLVEEGADPARIRVVPYGVDVEAQYQKAEVTARNLGIKTAVSRPLRVLVAGRVCLQKGSHYVLQAAELLQGRAELRMVGSLAELSESMLSRLRQRVEVLGPVPRPEMAAQYGWADVFLLPSLCEGSATVTYEALGYGLPVICTANTGSVVRDGMEGFIVPVRDATAIAGRIERLARDVELRAQMAAKAKARAAEFTVAAYGQRLLAALTGAMPLRESISA
jgi:glycosyltransferase involved in cell wall biosynthesis